MALHSPIALMLVTDRALCGSRPLEDVVLQAIAGGVDCVQLREKQLSTRAFVDVATRVREAMRGTRVPLLINDRVDVALAVEADGVHLGQGDMPVAIARRLLGQSAIIGLSVEDWKDVEAANSEEVDYLGVSPVFDTATKTDTKEAWGLDGLRRIKSYSRHALVAIGGVNVENVRAVRAAGAAGVAVVSAICSATDPRESASALARRS